MQDSKIEEMVHKLDEAIDDTDWEVVQEVIDELRSLLENPLDEYNLENW
jgi:hypothetical protein|tara:strand:- start:46 stop:192 length:147 start_codon:yes stop_codon:yes gene_type:complete